MSYLVLARKWRPQTFEEIIGQEAICKILKNAIAHNKVSHAYIFSGPRGVGKTTTARILSKALNCDKGPTTEPCGICLSCKSVSDGTSSDVIEIDGASNTGVENIRDLRERVKYAPSFGQYKIYIIDEVHMLSTSAFNALLKTLEEPPSHVIFVLATTEPRKIPATVLSRCQHLAFKRISHNKIKERLEFIANTEGLNITSSAIELIARAADGSMRDSLTILDQILSFSDEITESDVKDLLGVTDVEILSEILSSVVQGDRRKIISLIASLTETGSDLRAITRELLLFLRKLLITKIVGEPKDVIEVTETELGEITKLQSLTSEEHLSLLFSELLKAESLIRNAYYPRIALEITLIKLSLLSHFKSIDDAIVAIKNIKLSDSLGSCQKMEEDITLKPKISSRLTTFENITSGDMKVEDIWGKVLEKIDSVNHPLACKIRESEATFSNDRILLTFKDGHSIHAESVKNNLEFINNIISEVGASKNIYLEIVTTQTKPLDKKELKEKALKNPVIQEALKLFDGRILDVVPLNNKTGGKDV